MKKLETKFKEERKTVSELSEMKDMYLGERLVRTWHEDFTDEDTGDVVSIERNELILETGTFLNNHELSTINFYMQSGDIKEVTVSNQQRSCKYCEGHVSVWMVSAEVSGKKKTIYLYANSVRSALEISRDYIEQTYLGVFKFIAAKELDYSILISSNLDENERYDEEMKIYNIEVDINQNEVFVMKRHFILHAIDAEKAKLSIIGYLNANREELSLSESIEVTIISAKTIPCNDIINLEFSQIHLDFIQELETKKEKQIEAILSGEYNL